MEGTVCAVCGGEIPDPEAEGIWEKIEGWVPYRENGGANQVRVIRRKSIYAHNDCIRRRRPNKGYIRMPARVTA